MASYIPDFWVLWDWLTRVRVPQVTNRCALAAHEARRPGLRRRLRRRYSGGSVSRPSTLPAAAHSRSSTVWRNLVGTRPTSRRLESVEQREGGREGPVPSPAPLHQSLTTPPPPPPPPSPLPPPAAARTPHGRASGGTWRGRRPLRRSTERHSATPGGWRRCSARVVLARSRCALPRVHCTSLSSRPGRPAGAAPVRLTAQTRRQRLGSEQARAIGSGPAARRHLTTLR